LKCSFLKVFEGKVSLARPFLLLGYNDMLQMFDVTLPVFFGYFFVVQKEPKPLSSIRNIIFTFDLVSWTLIFLSVVIIGILFLIAIKIGLGNGKMNVRSNV